MWRYAWLMDDAFIYFRYIDNLLWLKLGLVYNQGEYVEGFSSPLWLIVLTSLRALHLNFWYITLLLGILSYFAFWWGLIVIDRQFWRGNPRINFPMVYLLGNYGVGTYFTSGLESPWVQLLAICYALYILNPRDKWLTTAIAISPLLRQEMLVPVILCAGWSLYRTRRLPLQLLLLTAMFVGSWLTFRIYYYADLLPNTFYLKDTVSIRQGLHYLHDTASPYFCYPLAAIVAMLLLWAIKRGEASALHISERLMMWLVAAAITIYVIKIGGDSRHFRYLAFPFCLSACACAGLLEFGLAKLPRPRLLAAFAAPLVLLVSFFAYPRQLRKHPFWFQSRPGYADEIGDAMAHRRRHDLDYVEWKDKVNIKAQKRYRQEHSPFIYQRVRVSHWCRSGYVEYHNHLVHGLGLTDAILGRTDAVIDRPAHRWGLVRLGHDIESINQKIPVHDRGMYRQAVESGIAPEWIAKQLDIIEILEKKIYNRHEFSENLQLAFTRVPKLSPMVPPEVAKHRQAEKQKRTKKMRQARRH